MFDIYKGEMPVRERARERGGSGLINEAPAVFENSGRAFLKIFGNAESLRSLS